MFFIFSLLCCVPAYVMCSHSQFFYAFPQHGFNLAPAAPQQQFIQHSASAFAPIFNPIQNYYTPIPQPLLYSAVPSTPSNERLEEIPSGGLNPFYGFAYKTQLNNDAISNVFFLSGSDAHQPQQIRQFISTMHKNENIEKNLPNEKQMSEFRSASEIIQELFGNEPVGFQYIYNSNSPPVPTARNIDENIPLTQRFGSTDDLKSEKNGTSSTTESNRDVENITEDQAKKGRMLIIEAEPESEETSESTTASAPTTTSDVSVKSTSTTNATNVTVKP